MSHKKVLELAKKFAEKSLNDQFQEQRQKLEQFSDDFLGKLRPILNKMEEDLLTLKEKGYDRNLWKELGMLRTRLISFYKNFSEDKPYESAQVVINFVFSKETFELIQKLHSSIQKHLKKTEVEFEPSPRFTQSRADSLQKLVTFMHSIKDFMKKNPLLPTVPHEQIVPSSGLVILPDPSFRSIGPEATTNPGVKIK